MNVLIENYRGIDIIFDTESQRFSFSFDEGSHTEKQSYNACKTNIDKYLKDNQDFKPIILRNDSSWKNCFEIIGLRKDGRFIQIQGGKKSQYSDYQYSTPRIYIESEDEIYKEADEIEKQIEALRDKKVEILNKLKAPFFNKEYMLEVKKKYGY